MNRKWNNILPLSILALAGLYLFTDKEPAKAQPQPAYERIMRSHTIRCSYNVWPPFLAKDPQTGAMNGVYYDLMERIGNDLKLKIEWVEEPSMFAFLDSVKSGRTDMYCSPVTPAPERTSAAAFTKNIAYLPYYLYAKQGDTRFDNNYKKLNNPAYSMMSIDGYFGSILIREDFPNAKYTTLSDFTTDTDVLMSIVAGKADTAPCLAFTAQDFMKNNPDKVHQIKGDILRNAPISLAVPIGEEKLKSMIDTAVAYYIDTGFLGKLFESYKLDDTKLRQISSGYR